MHDVVEATEPDAALRLAEAYLQRDPVQHNLALTILHERLEGGGAGRYWCVMHGDAVVGYGYHSPPDFPAGVFPMRTAAASALVDAVEPPLPGVIGEAATAARFAGGWAERHGVPAFPVAGQRLYRLGSLGRWSDPPGRFRAATDADRDFLVTGVARFMSETRMGAPPDSPDRVVDPALAAGRLWVWDDRGPVAMARHTATVAGVSRLGWVFTPPARRGSGYATACVGHLSARLRTDHVEVVLYADLANPTSNRLYRRLGYEAVSEVLHYRFA